MGRPKKIKYKGKGPKAYIDPDPLFKVPKAVYKKVFKELKNSDPHDYIQKQLYNSHVLLSSQHLCHSDPKENYCVTTKNGLNKVANYQTAAKQALDLRDFKAVYKICMKGFELKDKMLSKVLYEYLYLAIENDPFLSKEERELFLLEVVRGCKIMYISKGAAPFEFESENAALKHIKELHTLTKRNDFESDSDDDEPPTKTIKIEKIEPEDDEI